MRFFFSYIERIILQLFNLCLIDLKSQVHVLAEQATKNIVAAIVLAEKNIRSSIALSVVYTDIKNEKMKTEALSIMHKVLNIATGRVCS